MAVIAAAAVALPLVRDRHSRVLGVVVSLAVMGAAAGLYPLWSNWNWRTSAGDQGQVGADALAMVAKLEKHVQEQPDDAAGWIMLGRSYVVLQRLDDAVVAYDHAHRLDAGNADAALGLGEAMSLRAGGEITATAAQMFEQALGSAPSSPKALLYGGFAAAVRGDRTLARTRWELLKSLNPPPQIVAMLDARIAELGPTGGTGASPAGRSTVDTGSAPVQASVNISIAPALKARLKSEVPLFVFAREPGVKGPPLAAKRLTSVSVGSEVVLSAADAMLPGHALTAGQRVTITARISFSGQPTPAAGDLYGELTYEVGRDGTRELLIDRVAQ